jgi:hypothetical protein
MSTGGTLNQFDGIDSSWLRDSGPYIPNKVFGSLSFFSFSHNGHMVVDREPLLPNRFRWNIVKHV